jgi:hypothetical protein
METDMPIERIAALIWRFIGAFLVIAALPGLALPPFSSIFLLLLLFVQVAVGLLLIGFSRQLGKIIAQGL